MQSFACLTAPVRACWRPEALSVMCRDSEQALKSSKRGPVPRVHVDYTLQSGPERLTAVLPDEADRLSKTPFAVIQACLFKEMHLAPSDPK